MIIYFHDGKKLNLQKVKLFDAISQLATRPEGNGLR